jgi:Flp pilus assembly protein TadD
MARALNSYERLSLEFTVGLAEMVLADTPHNLRAVEILAHAYTRLGRVREGLALDRKLVAAQPQEPLVHYNLACSLCLCGEVDQALAALLHAVTLGYDDVAHLKADDDLAALRQHPRFDEVLSKLGAAG